MKKFIKKYLYLIYFIITIYIFTSKIVIVGPLILEYLVRLFERQENFIKKYSWAFFMGMITAMYGISIYNYRYFIINVISIILINIRKEI